jgi:hypothetical protein
LISNKNGKFTFCSIVGDKVSMVSTYPPNYEDNQDQIKDQDGISLIEADPSKRTIPLTPILIELTFRTVEFDNQTKLVPSADLRVLVNGKNVPPASSGNGEFVVKGSVSSTISIVASKDGYITNNTKIKNAATAILYNGKQQDRDIPMKKEPKPQPPKKNCGAFFTGLLAGGTYVGNNISEIFKVDGDSEYVGQGSYPSNTSAFPKSVASSFDGLAIDRNTRVIIYSEPNFKGKILLDRIGPLLINNIKWKDVQLYIDAHNAKFPKNLQDLFPPSKREWSSSNMNDWSEGSIKVICE